MSCKNDNIIFCANPIGSHEINFKHWEETAEYDGASKLAKARKPEKYLAVLAHIDKTANIYASYFGIELPETLKALLSIKDKTEFLEFADKKAEFIEAERKRNEAEQKRKFKQELKKWYNFETSRIYGFYKYDFLRFKDNRIETTQAVQIPLEIAKRLYNTIKEGTIKQGDKILNYSVDQIGAQIKIGCHTFKRSYLLEFGSKLS